MSGTLRSTMLPEDIRDYDVIDTGTSHMGDVAIHLRLSTGDWILVNHGNVRECVVLSSGKLSTELVKLVAESTDEYAAYVSVSRNLKLMEQFVSFREACRISAYRAKSLCERCWAEQEPKLEVQVAEIILE